MKVARSLLSMGSLVLASSLAWSAPADGQGLRSTSSDASHWQNRLSLVTRASEPWSAAPGLNGLGGQRIDSAIVMADYFFSAPAGSERTAGFRASGGVGLARRGSAWLGRMPLGANAAGGGLMTSSMRSSRSVDSDGATSTYPYLGVGYSGIYPKSGWGFTADVGLMGGVSPSGSGGNGLTIEGGNTGSQSTVDSQIRQMRLRPILQVGVSYSF